MTRRAYLATFVVVAPLFIFFTVEIFTKRDLRREKWDTIYFRVLSILLFIVVAVSAIGFVRISTAKAARLKTADDLYDEDDEGDGDEDDACVGLPRVDLVFDRRTMARPWTMSASRTVRPRSPRSSRDLRTSTPSPLSLPTCFN